MGILLFLESNTEKNMIKENEIIEKIKDEQEGYSDDSLYNITSFGTDLSFREIVSMYKEGDLEKPEMQRKYVWNKSEASRFIDSILLGLPVPSIFLAKTPSNKRLIVDGYQRIMTVYDYIEEGVFGGDGKVFKLSNTESINSKWRGKAYTELTEEQKRTIRTSPIHAIVFEQKEPLDDTGMYQIFERINTGGRVLRPQEIRNCVYHGSFNAFLIELNKISVWRKILRTEVEDSRMQDVELILRFFALLEIWDREEITHKQINLSKYLNEFMKSQINIDNSKEAYYREMFNETVEYLYERIGENLFRTLKNKDGNIVWAKKVNPVVFDAVCVATVKAKIISGFEMSDNVNLSEKYERLLQDNDFLEVTRQRTTNVDSIKKRVSIAHNILFGENL